MYNRFILQTEFQKQKQQQLKLDREKAWFKRYKTQVRPNLITKYEKRLQGFAKRMESNPVVLPEDDQLFQEKAMKKTHSEIKIPIKQKQSRLDGSVTSRNIKYKKINVKQMKQMKQKMAQKYIQPLQSFRERKKSRQINPPMKYGNKNSKNILMVLSNLKKLKKINLQSKTHNLSRGSVHSNDIYGENISQFDIMSINNSYLQARFEKFKTEQQKKEEEELKALSHDRLYFKSLMGYEQSVKDQNFKQNLKQVLIKCNVFKPSKIRRMETVQKDLFAEIMKINPND